MSTRSKWIFRAVMGLAVVTASPNLVGCAALRASGARSKHIDAQTRDYVYQQPLNKVWPQARQLLFSEGFSVKDTDSTTAETEWKKVGDSRERYLLSGIEVDEGTCRVQFTLDEQYKSSDGGWGDSRTKRDIDLEWKLLKQVDPEAARKIESEADAAGEQAKAQ